MKSKNPTVTSVFVQRIVLALLLVATSFPIVNIMQGREQMAQAVDSTGQPKTLGSTGGLNTQGQYSTSSTAIADKDEVIYALLSNGGTPYSGYVINHFKVDTAGKLVDNGSYGSTINLTSTQQLATDGNQISVPVEVGEFYYEGVLSTVELPWVIEIGYTLDSKRVEPTLLAGSTGKLEIEIQTSQNKKADPVFFENYVLQIQLSMASDKVKDLTASGATIANVGKNEQVVFMVLPGSDGDLRLTAQVHDFEMAGIQISGMPFSMVFDLPDTSSMIDDMASLTDAINELNEGVGKLKEGVGELQDGAPALSSGSTTLQSGLILLDSNASLLSNASNQIDTALALIAQQVNSESVDPDQILQLIDGLHQLSAGLSNDDPTNPGLAQGLSSIQDGLNLSIASLDGLIQGLSVIGADEIINLSADVGASNLTDASKVTIGSLISVNTQAATLVAYWNAPGGLRDGMNSATAGLDTPIATCEYMSQQLKTMADGLEASLGSLSDLTLLTSYLQQISSEYSTFNEGLLTYTQGLGILATNYTSFDSGLNQFLNGTGSLSDGMASLYSGTTELYINVKDLPQTMQDEIDSFLKDYQGSDFELRSFVAPENENISRVQFILLTDAIEIDVPKQQDTDIEPAQKSFWDRLAALFE